MIQLRAYQESDLAACMEAFESNVPKYFTNEEIGMYKNFLNRVAENGLKDGLYYSLIYEGKVVGAGGFGPQKMGSNLTLIWGLVHNDFHKKGLGEALLKHRIEQFQNMHPDEQLCLDTTQHSYTFFEKYGFVVTKVTNDYYEKGMHRYDMIL